MTRRRSIKAVCTTLQVLAAELSSKDGRASTLTMARLLQHLLARDPRAARRGFILDGWPRTLAQATACFCAQPSSTGGALLPPTRGGAHNTETGGAPSKVRLGPKLPS